ncbi:MAG: DegT/DnrJ/EryC1/StrS family aminotransferase [Candidatus Firestonebacteria bacterium]
MTYKFIPVSKPHLPAEGFRNVIKVLKSGYWSTGEEVNKFEKALCRYLGGELSGVGLSSCTAGLFLTLKALGIKTDDEIILPTFTFVATAHIVEWLGAKPVFVDIDYKTFNIDVEKIPSAITKKTKAIIPVHFAGLPCDIMNITKISRKNNLLVIEDAAHALGAMYKGKKIGNYSDGTVFSFYATKNLATGEGGMVVTRNKLLSDKIRRLSYFGMDIGQRGKSRKKGWQYEVTELGYKYNMDNIHAAIGLSQLRILAKNNKKRRLLAKLYIDQLFDIDWIELPAESEDAISNWHLFPIKIDFDKLGLTRKYLVDFLRKNNIEVSVHFRPLHMHPYYRKKYGYKGNDFPISKKAFYREISLPLFPEMKEDEVKFVCKKIKSLKKSSAK